MVELREFVSDTLLSIIKGVEDAQETLAAEPRGMECARINAKSYGGSPSETASGGLRVVLVSFDVAIGAQESTDRRGRIGVISSFMGLGAEAGVADQSSTASRVSFVVPVTFRAG
jgi:hypothetical protein